MSAETCIRCSGAGTLKKLKVEKCWNCKGVGIVFSEPEELMDHIVKNFGASMGPSSPDRAAAREGFRLCSVVAASKRIAVSEVVRHVQEEYRKLNP